ncbi:hypothetical protein NQ318_008855 [Aromia moschata]|uniref:Ribosomal protein S13 n=1 Tax=Aromia moschata TaxID=1265417 RepID=A0AAV8ZC33_9CUCU|nr:hypothetical protein NQ318_008855 [Aromia moschata]
MTDMVAIYAQQSLINLRQGIPSSKARAYINKHKLKYKEAALIMDSIKYCKKLGYSNKEILGTPQLLRVHPLELEQHYLSMEEGGFQSVGPKILARARYYMKREIKCLKDRKLICDSTEVPQNFLKYIEDKEINGGWMLPMKR